MELNSLFKSSPNGSKFFLLRVVPMEVISFKSSILSFKSSPNGSKFFHLRVAPMGVNSFI